MRTVSVTLAVVLLALCLVGGAGAKLRMSLFLSVSHPRVRQPVAVALRTEERADAGCRMRLLAVAPGVDPSRAIEAFVGGGVSVQGPNGYSFHRMRPTPRLGFEPRLIRTGARTWRGTLRFPRSGLWRLVVPNECAPGWMYPWPAFRAVVVR